MVVLYAATLAVGAALLFALEPLVGKLVLPYFGATPQVWTTTVMFFQAALLGGYAFAHATSLRLRPRQQALLQIVLLAAAAVVLPIALPTAARPPDSADPVLWLLGVLAVTAGPPFFAIAALGPMLQRWFAGVHANPYVLFAASNAGSILGLLAYPVVLEPLLALSAQGPAWSIGYGALVLLVVACALRVPRGAGDVEAGPAPGPESASRGERITWRRRASWLALAFVPSSLVLGTTAYVTRDLAPVPLLWVIPLVVYLATFVAAFAPGVDPRRLVNGARLALPAAAILVVYVIAIGAGRPLLLLLAVHLAGLAAAGLLCHARLAADRPPATRLTEFYLWVALGGVLGGAFNALLAPLVFPGLVEYPLAIVAACLLRPPSPKPRPALLEFLLRDRRPTLVLDYAVPAAVLVTVALGLHDAGDLAIRSAILGAAVGICVNTARRPVRFGLCMGAVLLAAALAGADPAEHVLARDRSFFGIYRVVDDGAYRALYDGTTIHGVQLRGARDPEPLSYYGREGPAGEAIAALPSGDRGATAVIGLGTGALACYGPATFYEIDPTVAELADRWFTYLRRCPGAHRVVLGDARQTLEREGGRRFGLLVVDAFVSDAVPVHLITEQALRLYERHLRPGGALLFNVSNRYLRLEPVLGNLARALRLRCVARTQDVTASQSARRLDTSTWVLLDRRAPGASWHRCATSDARVWTDDFSNVLGVLKL